MTKKQDPTAELAAKKSRHFARMTPMVLDVEQVSRVMTVLAVGPESGIVYEDGVLYVPSEWLERLAAIDPNDDASRRQFAAAEARRELLRKPLDTPFGRTWVDAGTRADLRETIAAIDAAAVAEPVLFKLADGFRKLYRSDLLALGDAISAHVAAAFAAEAAEGGA